MYTVNIKDVKDGMILWESAQQGNMQFKAKGDAFRHDGGWALAAKLADGRTIIYYSRDGNPFGMHHFYTEPAYTGVPTTYLKENADESTRATEGT